MKPYAIWSLLDMLRFHGAAFTAAVDQIATANVFVQNYASHGPAEQFDESWFRGNIEKMLLLTKASLDQLPLSPVVKSRFARLLVAIKSDSPNDLSILIREMRIDLINDLDAFCFLMIKPDKREFYEQKGPPFGIAVQDKFPVAGLDIAASSRCYALDEWTACVFHLMRVLEHGLRWLAEDVGLLPAAYEGENWKNVIDLVEAEIRTLEKTPKGPIKTARTQALSKAATQFRFFKDGWRNHVAHAVQNYDENAAIPVWDSAKRFMQALADPAFPAVQQNP